ncbi:hypothetical protein J8I87_28825 [Paraburkholderia sp. LEh10]|uniref:hypothetical protein n=1 Tax=Paraburkholderia sp. LEh10 TaxID=2821353 RepID=UPI001AE71468|nr:hypothetical protein [Paraburkholderia sp. LEh10]MBP0593624.1 hypothetical protein [Paraburkholderia sp. LEh10]
MILTSDWVIQRVMKPAGFARNRRWQYLPWAGYTYPMTGDQAMRALYECEAHWPAYEFRAHPIDGDMTRFDLPGQSADWTHPVGL